MQSVSLVSVNFQKLDITWTICYVTCYFVLQMNLGS